MSFPLFFGVTVLPVALVLLGRLLQSPGGPAVTDPVNAAAQARWPVGLLVVRQSDDDLAGFPSACLTRAVPDRPPAAQTDTFDFFVREDEESIFLAGCNRLRHR